MGWYHDPNFNWDSGNAPACSINDKPEKQEDSKPAAGSSGNTACPLPPNSPPPPPPPDVDSIYHLCQKSIWEEAVKTGQPYFPPTYMNDGKFTRATVYQEDLVATANEYYKNHTGEWIVLEIDCKLIYGLGIPILAQDAPESSPPQQPVKCLQVFGGISTTLPGLVKNVHRMERAPDGTFLKVVIAETPKQNAVTRDKPEAFPNPQPTRRGFWSRMKPVPRAVLDS